MTHLPQVPVVEAEKLQTIITQLDAMTWIAEGVFTSPEAMGDLFQHIVTVYGQEESLCMALTDAWQRVQGNFVTTGKAVSWIAMQQAMIQELELQRDATLDYDTTVSEILADQAHMMLNALETCGCPEEEADMFLQVFCDFPEDMPATAKELIRQAVEIVYTQEMEELKHVK